MTRNPRGPFLRVRWFCEDGTILPPEPFACRAHGGGVQHAQLRPEIAEYEDLGFHFGTIYRALEPEDVIDADHAGYRARELVVQAYLQRADDGWIMRRARFYRGALQAEDEERAGREILEAAFSDPSWVRDRPLLAARLVETVPHSGSGSLTETIRTLAVDIAELDPSFSDLRVKLHSMPGPGDIEAVAVHRRTLADEISSQLNAKLEELLDALRSQYGSGIDPQRWVDLAEAGGNADVRAAVAALITSDSPPGSLTRLQLLSSVAANGRRAIESDRTLTGSEALALLELATDAADRTSVQAAAWLASLEGESPDRRQLLRAARDLIRSAHADGWLTTQEHESLERAFDELLADDDLTAGEYHNAARYLSRAPAWAHAAARQTFAMVTGRYVEVEPMVYGFEDDLVRGSVLLPMSRVLAMLATDAGGLLGQEHEILDSRVRSGVLGLNPGVAVGPLHVPESVLETRSPDPAGIYVLPETPPELGRVAGILTLGQGSRLSHVQLLARALGIPNASIDPSHLERLRTHVGENVVYSVSPRGSVHLDVVPPEALQQLYRLRDRSQMPRLRIDESRLDLSVREILPLEEVDAADAGRIAGPKAANLGQLHELFPDRVAPGLVIPFGLFRAHVERTPPGGGPSIAEEIRTLFRERTNIRDRLASVRERIETMPLTPTFEQELDSKLRERFGEPGTYGVFVRSDTNVEDLPNFSGAGLNLTVMNVIGTEEIEQAIRAVWASPFTERAYGWRSEAVENPAEISPSIVILGSVPSDASGVLVTRDIDDVTSDTRGPDAYWTITLSPGIGGAVGGEETETTLVPADGEDPPLLLSSARTPWKKELVTTPPGGISDVPLEGNVRLLTAERLAGLRPVIERILDVYPPAYDAEGNRMPWDIEFGFVGDRTILFQIRPFIVASDTMILEDARALDERMESRADLPVDLDGKVSR